MIGRGKENQVHPKTWIEEESSGKEEIKNKE